MRSFELNIFIDRPRDEVFDQLAEPLNMIGLRPRLTTIDVLKEQKDTEGIVLRPFYTVETYRWAGLPIFRSRVYLVIHLTRPKQELITRLYGKLGTRIAFHYEFHEVENGKTHLVQKVQFEKVNKLIENFVYNEANRSQRALLTNLKVRLEK
ncbi:MAG: SRPBCC family protein [Anaerolineales bacterium]|nr:SRPBCC family protein [Anaerolineales bacterium]